MQISEIITPERMLCHVQASSKKRVLEYFSKLLATETSSIGSREIFDALLARERLGSTALGKGVAIPHARVAQCEVTMAAFLQIEQGINYDSLDDEPTDLFFALMVPENSTEEHLNILANIAEMFSDETFRDRLRHEPEPSKKFELLTAWKTT